MASRTLLAALAFILSTTFATAQTASVTRDERGRATVRAYRLTSSIDVDGRLDEELYRTVPPIDGFRQQVPQEGAPASEAERIHAFDPSAEEIIWVRPIQGG